MKIRVPKSQDLGTSENKGRLRLTRHTQRVLVSAGSAQDSSTSVPRALRCDRRRKDVNLGLLLTSFFSTPLFPPLTERTTWGGFQSPKGPGAGFCFCRSLLYQPPDRPSSSRVTYAFGGPLEDMEEGRSGSGTSFTLSPFLDLLRDQ